MARSLRRWRWSTPFVAVLFWAEDSAWRRALIIIATAAILTWVFVQLDAWQRRPCVANGGHMVDEQIWVPQDTKIGDVMVHTGTTRSTVSPCEGVRE